MVDESLPKLEIWIDGDCTVCRRSERWCNLRDHRRRLVFRDLHTEVELPRSRDAMMAAVHLRRLDGSIATGFEAWRAILAELPRWRWIGIVSGWPVLKQIGTVVYSVVAGNRHRSPFRTP